MIGTPFCFIGSEGFVLWCGQVLNVLGFWKFEVPNPNQMRCCEDKNKFNWRALENYLSATFEAKIGMSVELVTVIFSAAQQP
jgi:hypothetical protein